jgi:hypothetical protein
LPLFSMLFCCPDTTFLSSDDFLSFCLQNTICTVLPDFSHSESDWWGLLIPHLTMPLLYLYYLIFIYHLSYSHLISNYFLQYHNPCDQQVFYPGLFSLKKTCFLNIHVFLYYTYIYFWVFCGIGIWTQGLALARQAPYYLSHIPSHFFPGCFCETVSHFCPSLSRPWPSYSRVPCSWVGRHVSSHTSNGSRKLFSRLALNCKPSNLCLPSPGLQSWATMLSQLLFFSLIFVF